MKHLVLVFVTDFTWLLYFCLEVINSPLTTMLCVLILPLIALSSADSETIKPSDNKVSKQT